MSDLHNKYFRPLERLLSTELVGRDTFREYYKRNLEGLSSADLDDKGSKFAEIMRLFFYHIYRKLSREEYQRLRDTPRRRKPRRRPTQSI